MTVSIPQGSVEYLLADVTCELALINTQRIDIGITATTGAPTTWTTGEWVSPPAKRRTVRWLTSGTTPRGLYAVYVRPTDGPEQPAVRAGYLRIH